MRLVPLAFVLFLFARISLQAQIRDVADIYIQRGLEAEKRGDIETALRNYKAAIDSDPKSPYAYYYRGGLYADHGQCELARKDFETSLHLKPTWWYPANARGVVYTAMGRYDLALADYNKVLSLHPHGDVRATVLNNRARIEATCPDPKFRDGHRALQDAKEACECPRWKATHLATLATAYAELGDFANAIKCQQKAIILVGEDDNVNHANDRLDDYEHHRPYREQPECVTKKTKRS